MRVLFFSAKTFDREVFGAESRDFDHEISFVETRLTILTASLAAGFPVVCVFANDDVNADVLKELASKGTRLVALRCAGTDNVDLGAARRLEVSVVRVPAYSPHSVAEHAVALMLSLNRRICQANSRVREGNFALEGLLGFDMFGKTVGVVGLGRIGIEVARILGGFGCNLLGCDPMPLEEASEVGVKMVSFDDLLRSSDIVTLHCPLSAATKHMIDHDSLELCKPGFMLINTGRGALVDAKALIDGLKRRRIGYLGLDVYEEEAEVFFADHSAEIMTDDVLARLLTFPNVLITGHQGFFTREAIANIARATLQNINEFAEGRPLTNSCYADSR